MMSRAPFLKAMDDAELTLVWNSRKAEKDVVAWLKNSSHGMRASAERESRGEQHEKGEKQSKVGQSACPICAMDK